MFNLRISERLVILLISCISGLGGSYLISLLPGITNYWLVFLGWCLGGLIYHIIDGLIAYMRFKTLKW
jgi:hypothetical protein